MSMAVLPSFLVALPVLVPCSYLGLLAIQARPIRNKEPREPEVRFDIIVPAHDEESGIESTIASLKEIDYPNELYRIIVVADNCTDATAERAMRAGARVLVRENKEFRGKGYALEYAFGISREEAFASAVVVIDADTTVSPNLLRTFDVAIGLGAQAVQAEYGVRNPDSGWRTRLMSIALSTHHRLRNLARERMKLSVGLHGNGMAFTHTVLTEVPHTAFSVVEDLEYGIRLGYAGHRVHYADGGAVFGEMVASERASRTQRERWEGGRTEMLKTHAKKLLVEGFMRRNRVLFDLGMDLVVPPLAYVAAAAGVGLIATTGAALLFPVSNSIVLPWVVASACVGGYVARGVSLSPRGGRAVIDLAWAPVYVAWKFALKLRSASGTPTEWIRTERNA